MKNETIIALNKEVQERLERDRKFDNEEITYEIAYIPTLIKRSGGKVCSVADLSGEVLALENKK